MQIERIEAKLSVCKLKELSGPEAKGPFCFLSITDEEISLVCPEAEVPEDCLCREDGWQAFRIKGQLDFSLVGILAAITKILAEEKIGVFALSTYNTDYVLVKQEDYPRALLALAREGYEIL